MGGSRTATAASWGYRLQSTVYNSTLQQGSFSAGLRGTFLVASLTFALLFALFAKWINFAHLPPVLSHHSLLSPHMQTEISGIGLWTLQRGESESKSLAVLSTCAIYCPGSWRLGLGLFRLSSSAGCEEVSGRRIEPSNCRSEISHKVIINTGLWSLDHINIQQCNNIYGTQHSVILIHKVHLQSQYNTSISHLHFKLGRFRPLRTLAYLLVMCRLEQFQKSSKVSSTSFNFNSLVFNLKDSN